MAGLKRLVPRVCPQCQQEMTFAILPDKIECRHCGYTLHRDDGQPVAPPPSEAKPAPARPKTRERGDLQPSYALTNRTDIDRWAKAAFDSGQDYIRQQQWDEALDAFERAIDNQRDFVEAYLWVARVTEDAEVAEENLLTALAYDPGHLEVLKELMILRGELDASARNMTAYDSPDIQAAGGAVGTTTENLRCERCGATQMAVDPDSGLLTCGACGYVDRSRKAVATPSMDGSLAVALLKRRAQPVLWQVGERLLACDSCGAKQTIPARTLAQDCPYCGSNHVIVKDVLDSFEQPDGVVSFAISRQEAADALKARIDSWGERVKGWFNNNRVDRAQLAPVYMPFWSFDAGVQVRRTILRDNTYNERRRDTTFSPWNKPQMGYNTELLADAINDVQVCAVTSPPPKLTAQLGTFDLAFMQGYDPRLLAKVPAEIYDIDFDKASLEARSRISAHMRRKYDMIAQSDDMRVNIFTAIQQMSFQLVLMPVWVATLHEQDGDVRAALVNGQTGQVVLGKSHKSDQD